MNDILKKFEQLKNHCSGYRRNMEPIPSDNGILMRIFMQKLFQQNCISFLQMRIDSRERFRYFLSVFSMVILMGCITEDKHLIFVSKTTAFKELFRNEIMNTLLNQLRMGPVLHICNRLFVFGAVVTEIVDSTDCDRNLQ